MYIHLVSYWGSQATRRVVYTNGSTRRQYFFSILWLDYPSWGKRNIPLKNKQTKNMHFELNKKCTFVLNDNVNLDEFENNLVGWLVGWLCFMAYQLL